MPKHFNDHTDETIVKQKAAILDTNELQVLRVESYTAYEGRTRIAYHAWIRHVANVIQHHIKQIEVVIH